VLNKVAGTKYLRRPLILQIPMASTERTIVSLKEVKKSLSEQKPTKDGKPLPKPARIKAWPQGKVLNTNKKHAQKLFVLKLRRKKADGGVLTDAQEKLLLSWKDEKDESSNAQKKKPKLFARITSQKKRKIVSMPKKRHSDGAKHNRMRLKIVKKSSLKVSKPKDKQNSLMSKRQNSHDGRSITEKLSGGLSSSR